MVLDDRRDQAAHFFKIDIDHAGLLARQNSVELYGLRHRKASTPEDWNKERRPIEAP
jgi:hypothetical protein